MNLVLTTFSMCQVKMRVAMAQRCATSINNTGLAGRCSAGCM